mgnify:CR=1 FL=1
MIRLLTRIFIKNPENTGDAQVRLAYGRLCGFFGIFLNLLLFAGKYLAGLLSGSVAIMADAFNNLSDAGSSIISLLGFALSGKKPDPEHPFGHGRIEYLAGLLLAALILLMGFELAKSSFDKILHPQPVQAGLLPAVILLASILVKFYMSLYNRSIGKKIKSSAMLATATDSLSDAVSTLVVLTAMGVQALFHVNIDGWAGMAVAIFIMFAGFNAAKETLSPLLGQAPERELVEEVEKIVLAHPEVLGIHDLIVHDYGPGRLHISLHAEVCGSQDIFVVHDAIDNAEMEIKERFGAVTTIHMDPIEADNTEVGAVRCAVAEKLRELDPVLSIHDFRMVPGVSHTNLIFDTVVPAGYPVEDGELASRIKALIHESWPDRYAVVTIDHSYIGSGGCL